ncbi:alpha/beta hydrolase family protein [Marinoscillum pacificum]|uniref:alpha/beta hydrolase family protein n=1 Tax=Marinoscillum pacificum TaxID=392723 RepID=UPI00215814C7|nr:prolyl oligopeptidase family serine peptidase [Marinoscillum pacificum]
MRLPFFFLFWIGITSGFAQKSKLIVESNQIKDFSKYPFYKSVSSIPVTDDIPEWFSYIDSVEVFEITYLSDGLQVKGILVQPKKEGKYPCVIYNRGGNKEDGTVSVPRALIQLGKLASSGYVVIASHYRGNLGGEGVEEFGGADVNDVTILPKILAEIPRADTSRIGMYGWSRGGMMTYLALKEMTYLKAVVVGGALSDAFQNVSDRPEMEAYVFSKLVPDYWNNTEAELTKRSAIKWADQFPKDVPILMMHGTSDWRIKPEQSLRMALEFDKYRIPYRLIMFEGGDHGIWEHKERVNEEVLSWFDRFLKNGEALPDMEFHGR